MQTNADIARRIPNVWFMIRRCAAGLEYVAVEKEDGRNVAFEYVAVEKEYVAVEKEIQKHPHEACRNSQSSPSSCGRSPTRPTTTDAAVHNAHTLGRCLVCSVEIYDSRALGT